MHFNRQVNRLDYGWFPVEFSFLYTTRSSLDLAFKQTVRNPAHRYEPVSGPQEEALKGTRITSALATIR
jgi:hypothetical protein